nr:hypothetical protein CFP56_65927 [Quercus suber]
MVDTATILVGEEKVAFVIHVELFQERSAFFKAALSHLWRKSPTNFNFPEDDPEIFSRYMNYVYSGTLITICGGKNHVEVSIAFYALADKLGDYKAMNACMDTISGNFFFLPKLLTVDVLELCYAVSNKSSPLRRVCVGSAIHSKDPDRYSDVDGVIPHDFHRDLAVATLEILCRHADFDDKDFLRHDRSERLGKCYYHVHDTTMHPKCPDGNSRN